MKKWLPILLILLLILPGCSSEEENTVQFYYLRKEVTFGSQDSVIAAETREIHEENPDLKYLLTLYLKGPLDETLEMPVGRNVRVTNLSQDGDSLTVSFSSELSYLDDIDLTIACACISQTCFALTDVQILRIEAPAVEYGTPILFTIHRDSFLLFDDTTTPPEAEDAS